MDQCAVAVEEEEAASAAEAEAGLRREVVVRLVEEDEVASRPGVEVVDSAVGADQGVVVDSHREEEDVADTREISPNSSGIKRKGARRLEKGSRSQRHGVSTWSLGRFTSLLLAAERHRVSRIVGHGMCKLTPIILSQFHLNSSRW